jgi:hypothetical protein
LGIQRKNLEEELLINLFAFLVKSGSQQIVGHVQKNVDDLDKLLGAIGLKAA